MAAVLQLAVTYSSIRAEYDLRKITSQVPKMRIKDLDLGRIPKHDPSIVRQSVEIPQISRELSCAHPQASIFTTLLIQSKRTEQPQVLVTDGLERLTSFLTRLYAGEASRLFPSDGAGLPC